jgi:hypothetical protein
MEIYSDFLAGAEEIHETLQVRETGIPAKIRMSTPEKKPRSYYRDANQFR